MYPLLILGLGIWIYPDSAVCEVARDWNATELRFLEEGGLPCFRCSQVVSPEECEVTTVCSPQEECVTREQVIGDYVMYDLGCKNQLVCRALRETSATGGHGECEECCASAYCNSKLCKQFNLTQIQCHVGNGLQDPHESQSVVSCPPGEVCYSTRVSTDEHFVRYYMGCAVPQACDNASKLLYYMKPTSTSVDQFLCSKCCTTSFCNQAICQPQT